MTGTTQNYSSFNYWWASQGSYYSKELSGGYLWVPKKCGKIVHHWERIKELKTGDTVFSYVDQSIVACSEVILEHYESNRPIPMPEKNIINEGFRVDLRYHPLSKPLILHQIVDELQQILVKQTKYRPLNKNGQGNQGYIFPIINEAGDLIIQRAKLFVINI